MLLFPRSHGGWKGALYGSNSASGSCCPLAVQSWPSHLTFLGLSFLTCQLRRSGLSNLSRVHQSKFSLIIITQCSYLKYLEMSILRLCEARAPLSHLNLWSCKQFTPETLIYPWAAFPRIRWLIVPCVWGVGRSDQACAGPWVWAGPNCGQVTVCSARFIFFLKWG